MNESKTQVQLSSLASQRCEIASRIRCNSYARDVQSDPGCAFNGRDVRRLQVDEMNIKVM